MKHHTHTHAHTRMHMHTHTHTHTQTCLHIKAVDHEFGDEGGNPPVRVGDEGVLLEEWFLRGHSLIEQPTAKD